MKPHPYVPDWIARMDANRGPPKRRRNPFPPPPPKKRRFILDANPSTAPGCVEILCPADPDQGELVQTDWDFPATARRFGWTMRAPGERCAHAGTDGIIDCPECGKTASQFIHAARNWIDDHDGKGILE